MSTPLTEFLETSNHTIDEIIAEVKRITGIEFPRDHPLYGFYQMPASTKFHGCFKGGLAIHSLRVFWCALKLAPAFGMTYDEVDANACIFHDLVKVDAYTYNTFAQSFTYNYNAVGLPHGSESLRRMYKYNIPISSEAWELAVAYHMGAFEPDSAQAYSKACEKHKAVLLLHTADMMATKLYNQ